MTVLVGLCQTLSEPLKTGFLALRLVFPFVLFFLLLILLSEAAEEASSSTAAQYETERATLQKLNRNYEEEIKKFRNKLSQDHNLDKLVNVP